MGGIYMKKIDKAVVISDLHLGVEESLFFTQNHARYTKTINWLTQELSQLGTIDELIFLGDLLDLSLVPYDIIYPDARKFFKAISALANIKEIVFVPGNHDHHLWIEHVERDQIVERMKHGKAPKENNYFFRLVDSKYPTEDPDVYDNDLVLKHLLPDSLAVPPMVSMKYANHLRRIGEKHYLFTHGHFLEDGFTPFQFLFEAVALEDLETYNILWVEAVDYHLGHSGRLSDKVREIYHECIINKNTDKLNKVIIETANYLQTRTGLGKLWILAIKIILKKLVCNKIEGKDKTPLRSASAMRFQGRSDKLLDKIEMYIKKFILDRYRTTNPNFKKNIPFPFTFVFGHTHDYFYAQKKIGNDNYDIYNTGGWTVNNKDEAKDPGILVIDANGCTWKKYVK
jgi:hypothetical protein